MALYLMLTSALFASLQNLFMRKSVDTKGSTGFYVLAQLLISACIACLLGPVRSQNFAFDPKIAMVGIGLGALLGIMMWALGEALKSGSSGLSFATLNSSSILPAILMTLLFGAALGHPYRWFNGVGSLLVVGGIFLSSLRDISCKDKARWILFMSLSSLAFVLFSAGTQWKVLLETSSGKNALLPFALEAGKDSWMMPIIFVTAALVQLFTTKKEGIRFSSDTLFYGLLGGISNGSSMFFMLLATTKAMGHENALLFPLFSIAVIQICNLFGQYFYKEKIQWAPQYLSIGGLILGSVEWSSLFGG